MTPGLLGLGDNDKMNVKYNMIDTHLLGDRQKVLQSELHALPLQGLELIRKRPHMNVNLQDVGDLARIHILKFCPGSGWIDGHFFVHLATLPFAVRVIEKGDHFSLGTDILDILQLLVLQPRFVVTLGQALIWEKLNLLDFNFGFYWKQVERLQSDPPGTI